MVVKEPSYTLPNKPASSSSEAMNAPPYKITKSSAMGRRNNTHKVTDNEQTVSDKLRQARDDTPRPGIGETLVEDLAVRSEWEYNRLLDRRPLRDGSGFEYLVDWAPTWEPASGIAQLEKAVSALEHRRDQLQSVSKDVAQGLAGIVEEYLRGCTVTHREFNETTND